MLILPPGHAESVRIRRALSAREKRIIGVLLAAIAALAVVLVVSLGSAARNSHNGCIYLTTAAATGAQEINQCGAAARTTCASARAPGAYSSAASDAIAAECRKAGLPVG